jgi:hypothetical protein
MLKFVRGKSSQRKLRLFAVACCRRIWHVLPDERSKRAVEVAEQYADGLVGDLEMASANSAARSIEFLGLNPRLASAANAACRTSELSFDLFYATTDTYRSSANANSNETRAAEYIAQCRLLLDVLGNPFRPVAIEKTWLTPAVIELAHTIYSGRSFENIPRLAEALESAGCKNEVVLSHCRESEQRAEEMKAAGCRAEEIPIHCPAAGDHVRGCWVVDLLLGKE